MTHTSPKARAIQLVNGYQTTCLIIAGHKTGLFAAISISSLPLLNLASQLRIRPDLLLRFVRCLESLDLVRLNRDCVELTDIGIQFANDMSGISTIPTLVSEQYLPAWSNLSHTLYDGIPAFQRVFGVSVWQHRHSNTHLDAAFAAMIKEPATNEIATVLDSYDFSGFSSVMDVGGGQGWLLTGILQKNANMLGILFDQPHVVEGFLDRIHEVGIRSRCRVVGGSFFESVPADAELYLLQSVLHDWDNEACVDILKVIRMSMHKGDRLLVLERLMPTIGTVPRPLAMLDMHMMAVLGGRERTVEEYKTLLKEAGLKVIRVIPTGGLAADIIEVEVAD